MGIERCVLKARDLDDSFKRPGSIPFKWEIQPGIPKPYYHTMTCQNAATTEPPPLQPVMPMPPELKPPPYLLHSSSRYQQDYSGCFLAPSAWMREATAMLAALLQPRTMSAAHYYSCITTSDVSRSTQAKVAGSMAARKEA